MLSIGLDVHERHTNMCILDEKGRRIKQRKIAGPIGAVVEELKRLDRPLAVCYEASCGYGYRFEALRRVAQRVVVVHPGQVRLIFKSKRKTDRIDAKKLATLLFLDEVPAVHVPNVQVRTWRNLIEFRHRSVAKRTRAKNALRSLHRGHGVALPQGKKLWTRKGLIAMVRLALPTEDAMLQRDLLLDELEMLETQIQRLEKKLNQISQAHPGVHLLQTIPGVGPRTAEAVMAYIDDPKRFRCNKQVGAYFGLVPTLDQSAGPGRYGHITREGPATVRKLLTEAAWQGIRRSPELAAYCEQVRRNDPDRRKIALVATAHHLVRVMHAMLRTGEIWRGEQEKEKTKAA